MWCHKTTFFLPVAKAGNIQSLEKESLVAGCVTQVVVTVFQKAVWAVPNGELLRVEVQHVLQRRLCAHTGPSCTSDF